MTAERLKELREKKGCTQEQVGEYLGVTRMMIQKYESGIILPSGFALIKLADFFGVSTDYILGRTDKA